MDYAYLPVLVGGDTMYGGIATAAQNADASPVVFVIGGPVLAMLIFAILAFAALGRKETSNRWALFWAALFGLALAATPAGQAITGWINDLFNWLGSFFGGASAT